MPTETLPPLRPTTTRRFSRRNLLAGTALAAVAAGLYPTEIERHFIEIVPRTFRIANLPAAFRGFRIAQLSDIHLEWFTEDYFLRHAVHKINALKPDMVLLTGDYITNNLHGPDDRAYAAMPHCGKILSGLESPLRFGSLGNHDAAVDPVGIAAMLARNGITPLVNRHVPIDRNGQRLWVAALDDCYFGAPDLDLAVPGSPGAPLILMCHEPDYIDTINLHPKGRFVDLVLSGHTHGGQVRLPFHGPLILPPMGQKYPAGHYRFQNVATQLYVNRGLGTVGYPIRFDCPPEITHITLETA
jgi:predicted MPP superfamily phosphohydrolase